MSECLAESLNNNEIEIRTCTPVDIGALAFVMQRAYAQRDTLPLPDVASIASDEVIKRDLNTPNVWSYVAFCGRKAAGFTTGYPSSDATSVMSDPETEYLSLLMVDPEYWGRGIGSMLLGHAENHVRNLGRRKLVLWTRQADNIRTQSFYERRLYKRTAITRNDGPFGPQYQYVLDFKR